MPVRASSLSQFVAVVTLLVSSTPAMVQPPAKDLTAQQKDMLKESERLDKERSALEKAGKLAEAIVVLNKKLAFERSLFGDVHENVVDSLRRLARMHESLQDYSTAQKERTEVLALVVKLYGDKAWQVTDARLALAYVKELTKLTDEDRSRLEESHRSHTKADDLYNADKYKEALPLARQALEIRQKILGADHVLVTESRMLVAYIIDADFFERTPRQARQRPVSAAGRGRGL